MTKSSLKKCARSIMGPLLSAGYTTNPANLPEFLQIEYCMICPYKKPKQQVKDLEFRTKSSNSIEC